MEAIICRVLLFFLILGMGMDSGMANAKHLQSPECEKREDYGISWAFCVGELSQRADDTQSRVLYYFHGDNENERAWFQRDRPSSVAKQLDLIRQLDPSSQTPPVVVTISFGRTWLLAERNDRPKSGLYEFFIHFIMPLLEKKLGIQPIERLLYGESMGGLNALQLAVKEGHLFSRVVLACPIIGDLPAFSPVEDFLKFAKLHGVGWVQLAKMMAIPKIFFPDEATWETAAPLLIARKHLGPDSPAIHISYGDRDEYGIRDGVRKFVDIANQKGVKEVVFQELSGKHCTIDADSIAMFLSR